MERRILTYRLFEEQNTQDLSKEQIEWLDKCTRESWKLNPDTGLVDVNGSFDCSEQGLTDFKGVRFGNVVGSFWCYRNQLTSLDGAPKEVGGGFFSSFNQLTSLVGAPEKVGENFFCENNQLTSLVGAPKEVGMNFFCDNNQLTSLEGAPKKVGGSFHCYSNQLTSLNGAPEIVGLDFLCMNNQLTSLEGSPKEVGLNFSCRNNQLISLIGAPKSIGRDLYCMRNSVSERTILAICKLMKRRMSYTASLLQYWNRMPEEDKLLMYKDNPYLTDDKRRGYELRNRVSRICI